MTIQEAYNFAIGHHQAGRFAEAENIYRQILAQQPKHADSMQMLGMLLHQRGRSGEAVELISAAIGVNPNIAEYYANLAVVLGHSQRFTESATAFGKAIAIKPSTPEFYSGLADALCGAGRWEEAVEQLRRAVTLRPDFAQAYYNMGNILHRLMRGNEALAAYDKALKLRPEWPELVNNYGNVLANFGHYDPAIAAFRRAAALRPTMPETYCNLGNALRGKMELDASEQAYRQALALRPEMLDAQCGLACVLALHGKLEEGVAIFNSVIEKQPSLIQAHWEIAPLLLALGDWKRGWEEHEWRWQVRGLLLPTPPGTPRWDGREIAGKTIFVFAEQGIGDNLQFARYIPLIAKGGAKVVLACQQEMLPLMRRVEGVESASSFTEPIPAHDVHCALLSLPWVMNLGGEIPSASPYMSADEEIVRQWRMKLPDIGRKRVGLVWQGNILPDQFRSVPLEKLGPLGEIKDVDFVALQIGKAGEAQPPAGLEWTNLGQQIRSFADTAALMALMDLVITIDTSSAHLAGALGRPTWLLLRKPPDWRWKLSGEKSEWYPTMRLFRQPTFGDWDSVIAEVAAALRTFAAP